MDLNGDASLSINELNLFVKGATLTRQEKIAKFDPKVKQEMQSEILELYKVFDENGDGKLEAHEIHRSL